jgi:DNA helicase II / ATP-dependent DNA helicase PcrA
MVNKFISKKSENSHVIKANIKHNWSEYQKNIFKSIAKDSGHLIVEAYAGSSKTTSAIESFKYVPKGKKTLALAFNKIIQEELRARSPSYIECFTFHSLGFRSIKQRFGAVELDDNKVFNIVADILDKKTEFDLINNICDTVAYCKYTLSDTPKQIENLILNFGIDTCEMDDDKFIKLVINTLGKNKALTSKIDFNDMCWLPFVYNLPLGQYDYVYVDEAQDLNKSQLVMARKASKTTSGRIIIIMDPNQALYSWRGADSTVVSSIKEDSTTKSLQLPISYRCPKQVIDLAKKWVPDIICPDTAPEGEVSDITIDKMYDVVDPGAFILSRTNAPMIKICMTLIKRGIKANIRGRDVGKQLNYLIKKSKKKQIPAFLKWLENWKDEEVERLLAKKINTDNVLDRYECLVSLCEEHKTLDEVSNKIDHLFDDTDEKNIVILSSVHRAKGLERDNVFILRWTFRQWLDDKLEFIEKPNEEANIAYVAATRAKKSLYIVRKSVA